MSNGVMIALLPTSSEWCKQDLPHMTLVYAGKAEDLSPTAFNEMAKEASSLSMLQMPVTLRVKGVEVFGDGSEDSPEVDVFTLEPNSELLAMRHFVEDWDASEHPFNPHVTVGPRGSFVEDKPFAITFNKVIVAFGDESLTFWLKGGAY